jgi:peroxiredoxin
MKMSKRDKKPAEKTSRPVPSSIAIFGGLIVAGLLGIVVLRAAFPGTYFYFKDIARQFTYRFRGITIGSEAPDFAASTLEGESYTLSQFRGQPVIISFGAGWCPDCRKQAPMLNEVHARHPELVILEISQDKTEAEVRQFIADFEMEFPVLVDPGAEIYRRYQNFGIPATFFIDADGIIRARMIATVTEERMQAGLEALGVKE